MEGASHESAPEVEETDPRIKAAGAAMFNATIAGIALAFIATAGLMVTKWFM